MVDSRADGIVERHDCLTDQPDRGAQRRHGHRSHVLAVERDRSRVQLVEAWDQVEDRRLACTGWADQRHGLARRYVERDAVERRLAGFVGEVCVMQLDPALRSEEHTSELQSLMRSSYAVFCLKKKNTIDTIHIHDIAVTQLQS